MSFTNDIVRVIGNVSDLKKIPKGVSSNSADFFESGVLLSGKFNQDIWDTKMKKFYENSENFLNFNKKLEPSDNFLWHRYHRSKLLREGKNPLKNGENINDIIKKTLPYDDYAKLKQKTDALAREYGFRDEDDFARFIAKCERKYILSGNGGVSNSINFDPKLQNLFQTLKTYARKHPKSIIVVALASGTLAGMLMFIANIHKHHTGCFRYHKNSEEGGRSNKSIIKYKVGGDFCLGYKSTTSDSAMNSDKKKNQTVFLPEEEHPLYGKRKWNCDFNRFNVSGSNRNNLDIVQSLGCNGLCDILNFNTLALLTTEYEPVILTEEEHAKFDKYMFVCERGTILRYLVTKSLDTVTEVVEGILDSRIGKNINSFMTRIIYYIFFLILFYIIVSVCLKNQNNNRQYFYHQSQPLISSSIP